MTPHLQLASDPRSTHDFAPGRERGDRHGHEEDLRQYVQTIAEELEHLRLIYSQVQLATLLAEVREAPSDIVCAALKDLASAGERTVATLRRASAEDTARSPLTSDGGAHACRRLLEA